MHSYIVKYRFDCGNYTQQVSTCLVNVPILAQRKWEINSVESTVASHCPNKDKPGFKITSVTGPVTEIYNA